MYIYTHTHTDVDVRSSLLTRFRFEGAVHDDAGRRLVGEAEGAHPHANRLARSATYSDSNSQDIFVTVTYLFSSNVNIVRLFNINLEVLIVMFNIIQ